jgi:hypothetical protein
MRNDWYFIIQVICEKIPVANQVTYYSTLQLQGKGSMWLNGPTQFYSSVLVPPKKLIYFWEASLNHQTWRGTFWYAVREGALSRRNALFSRAFEILSMVDDTVSRLLTHGC